MEFSPSKRRKTSPISSPRISEQSSRKRPASQDGDRPSSKRPSFMTPTKASLARFNPSLLPLGSHWRDMGEEDGFDSLSKGARAIHVYANTNGSSITAHNVISTTLPENNGEGFVAALKRSPPVTRKDSAPSKKGSYTVAENARASPPEEARDEDNAGQLFQAIGLEQGTEHTHPIIRGGGICGGTLRATGPQLPSTPTRSGADGTITGMDLGVDGEPSLPSTPIHLGLEKPLVPPKGLLFSNNSKKSKRRDNSSTKSSPLKQHKNAEVQSFISLDTRHSILGPRLHISGTPKPPLAPWQLGIQSLKERLDKLEERLMHHEDNLLRQLLVSRRNDVDRQATKKTSKCQKELLLINTQIIRIRQEIHQVELTNGTHGEQYAGESWIRLSSRENP